LLVWQIELHIVEHTGPHFSFKSLFTQLTLQGSPEITRHSVAVIDMPLRVKPFFQTLLVDLPHTSSTLARDD